MEEKMQKKFLGIGALALLQIVIVGNLQVLPANAVYGTSLPFLYLLAIIGFFIPCILMVAELATTHPQTGGAYIWCEKAFGAKTGFFTVCILWVSNLLWYPSIFTLIAANVAYLINPALAQNKAFIISMNIILFWTLTGLNCISIKLSSKTSVATSILGIIIPMIVIIIGGFSWWFSGKSSAIHLDKIIQIPNISHLSDLGLLIAIVISLFGIELSAVHAGNVINPRKDFPASLLISGIITVVLLLLAELAIAVIIPEAKLNVETGLLDALTDFFKSINLAILLLPLLLLVLVGNLGSVLAWMLGSTRGMYVACKDNQVTQFLQKVNRYEAPIGVLIFEAVIFTIASSVFFLFPKITDSFWLMLDLASEVSLIYYILLFISAIRLRYRPREAEGFMVPGGNILFGILMTLGALTSLLTFFIGFIPPDDLTTQESHVFHIIMVIGLLFTVCLPFFFLSLSKKNKST